MATMNQLHGTTAWISLTSALMAAVLLTGVLRRYALARNVLDVPNTRSSHTVPTPRGGGVAIASTFLAAILILSAARVVDPAVAAALSGAGLIVAIVGFLDDHRPIAPQWRLLAHVLAAAWALAWLGGLPPLSIAGMTLPLGWVGHSLALLYVVWLLNLYNFMDGIDGIAGVQAVTVGLGAALMHKLYAPAAADWLMPALLATAALGFLVWNWPPARIFMGDAGSGFLGVTLGVLSIASARMGVPLFWGWVILLAVFIVDATLTLLRRLGRGEPLHQAHQSHAYQVAARRFGAHRPVTIAVGLINIGWLLPLALAVTAGQISDAVGVALAYAPLVALAIAFADLQSA